MGSSMMEMTVQRTNDMTGSSRMIAMALPKDEGMNVLE